MRIFVAGRGDPIPENALPDAFVDPDFPILTFELDNGENFPAGDYAGLGYTNFEVWCVGAAGGDGSPAGKDGGWPYRVVGGVNHWHDPFLAGDPLHPTSQPFGFPPPGGGGGLHHVVGYLADLTTLVPAVVGVAGAHAPLGYIDALTPYTPAPNKQLSFGNVEVSPAGVDPGWPGNGSIYDLPHPTWPRPADGGNGGASTFGGTVCRASGGKGGQKSVVGGPYLAFSDESTGRTPLGTGGDGGTGNTTVAGGGGLGSNSGLAGTNGTWDGVIGKGGGGGRGGYLVEASTGGGGTWPELYREATSGGRGSFAFGDTSVYGEGEARGAVDDSGHYVHAGHGGGARIPGLAVGSYALGYLPRGAVVVRIAKIS